MPFVFNGPQQLELSFHTNGTIDGKNKFGDGTKGNEEVQQT